MTEISSNKSEDSSNDALPELDHNLEDHTSSEVSDVENDTDLEDSSSVEKSESDNIGKEGEETAPF